MKKNRAGTAALPGKNTDEAVEIADIGSRLQDVAVIGAGASGCMAAVSAAKEGAGVLLIDANDKICRKIYATGNGRCNLTNYSDMPEDYYHVGGGEGDDLTAFFSRFSVNDHVAFWESNGVRTHNRQGYVYPRTDQASTIAEAYEKILRRLNLRIVLNQRVVGLKSEQGWKNSDGSVCDIFKIETDTGDLYYARKVILAGGGMAGPQYGCHGDMYGFAAQFGHTVTKPLPALVQLISDDKLLKAASGVRCDAMITLFIDGRSACSESGELQMTEKGISGIPAFQLSADAARALEDRKEVRVEIDFLQDFIDEEWEDERKRRFREDRNCMLSEFFLGLVNRKVLDLILRRRGLQAEKKALKLSKAELYAIMQDMRAFRVRIVGTGTFEQAQVTSGGIPISETDDDLQSKKQPGLYMAGELLDVDGLCGGYNLQWAATSGWITGKGAARAARRQKAKYKQ